MTFSKRGSKVPTEALPARARQVVGWLVTADMVLGDKESKARKKAAQCRVAASSAGCAHRFAEVP